MQNQEKREDEEKQQQQKEKQEGEAEKQEKKEDDELPMMALNHVSRLCRNVKESVDFYVNILGFVLIERPLVLHFEGAWLFNYGIGIHLLQSKDEDKLPPESHKLDPQDNHISFQCEDMDLLEKKLKGRGIKYIKRTLEDKDTIDQLFFNDPDGFMIEICNCENLKLVPAESISRIKLPSDRHTPPVEFDNGDFGKDGVSGRRHKSVEQLRNGGYSDGMFA